MKTLQWDPDFNMNSDFSPLFSTALIHLSTKLGTVVLSCAQSVDRWQPNTLSEGNNNIITIIIIIIIIISSSSRTSRAHNTTCIIIQLKILMINI